jgi:phosphoglycolate phosphatase
MSNPLKLVVFDCDGTLVDSQHMIVAAMHSAYAHHKVPAPAREILLSIVGLSLPNAFERLGEGQAGFPVASFVEAYKAAFFELRKQEIHLEPLYPGAREAVEALAARDDVVLGIATGKSRRGVDMVLGRHGLRERFITIQTADDAPSKPDPGMVLNAMRETGTAPEHTIVIGDTAFDVSMARAAGAQAIGVAWGYHRPEELAAAGARVVIEAFGELMPNLARLWAELPSHA